MEPYKCEGPGCLYTCNDRKQIEEHHIVPRERGGSNSKMNLIRLCPNCHARVFIPEAKRGNHAIKATNYLILKGVYPSSGGLVVEYEDHTSSGFSLLDTWRNTNIDRIKNEQR